MNNETLLLSLALLALSANLRIIGFYSKLFRYHMFNVKVNIYDKKTERPRLYMHLVALLFFSLAFYFIKNINVNSIVQKYAYLFGALILTIVSVGIIIFTWTNRFKNKWVEKVTESINDKFTPPLFKENIDIDEIIKKTIECDKPVFDKESTESLKLFLIQKGENLSDNIKRNKIKVIATSDKVSDVITYYPIFELLNVVLKADISLLNVDESLLNKVLILIINNFTRKDEEIKEKLLKKSYNRWVVKKVIKEDNINPVK